MKTLLNFLVLCLVATTSQAAIQGGHDGNGGAGVVKNGKLMSFYSAGFWVPPSAQGKINQLPIVDELFDYISSMSSLSMDSKTPILNAIQPSLDRTYLELTPDVLTPQVKARLLAEFQRVTGVSPSKLRLAALTDTGTKTTYLLPEFKTLSHADQLALLFHENYWILHPSASYSEVINAEMAFEATYTHPNDKGATYDFLKYVGSVKEVMQGMLNWDRDNLQGLVNSNGQIPLDLIFGKEYISCLMSPQVRSSLFNQYPKMSQNQSGLCLPYLKHNRVNLIAAYPNSQILKNIASNIDSDSTVDREFVNSNGAVDMEEYTTFPYEILYNDSFGVEQFTGCQADASSQPI